jgi:hypothetical protein
LEHFSCFPLIASKHRNLRATLQMLRLVSKRRIIIKAIIIAFIEAFNVRNYTAIEQYIAENIT